MPKFWTLSAIVLTLLATSNQAAFASGARGGGETIDLNGHPVLLELVNDNRYTCQWFSGVDLLKEPKYQAAAQAMENAIAALAKLDWYFARDLRMDIEELDFCLTGALKKLPPKYDDVIAPYHNDKSQIAIRINRDVYLDSKQFDSALTDTQAYLLIHEAMHSYLWWRTDQRSLKLRSMVKTIHNVEAGVITTRANLHFQMEKNDISFPRWTDKLDAHRDYIEFFLLSPEQRRLAVLAITNPEEFFKPRPEIIPYLAPWHREHFSKITTRHFPPLSLIYTTIASGDLAAAASALNKMIPLETASIAHTYGARGAKIEKYRLSANEALSELLFGSKRHAGTPLASLESKPVLNTDLQALAIYVGFAYQVKATAALDALLANPSFTSLVSAKPVLGQIQELETPIPREIRLARQQTLEVYAAWMTLFLDLVQTWSDKDSATDFSERLAKLDLGYPIALPRK
jgi:hypothetical protein